MLLVISVHNILICKQRFVVEQFGEGWIWDKDEVDSAGWISKTGEHATATQDRRSSFKEPDNNYRTWGQFQNSVVETQTFIILWLSGKYFFLYQNVLLFLHVLKLICVFGVWRTVWVKHVATLRSRLRKLMGPRDKLRNCYSR